MNFNDFNLEFQEKADPKTLEIFTKIGNALAIIYKAISRPFPMPKLFQIKGSVEVTKSPAIEIKNLRDLEKYFNALEQKIALLATAINNVPQPKINLPKIEIPSMPQGDNVKVVELLEDLNTRIENLKFPEVKFPKNISVDNFPVQKIPQPVTHISLNALQGYVKTTDNTVGTTLTKLPSYGQLFNRRAVMIYNNSANTIYIGGSDITTTTGLPIPASSYSPVLDLGYNTILYGIASQAGNDVRCIEVSDENSGR